MFDWLRSAGRKAAQSLSLVSPWLRNITWTINRAYATLANEAYAGNSVVYACLRLLCRSVAEPPLLVYTVGADDERQLLPYDHPLHALIRRPNPHMSEAEFWQMVALQEGIAGRSIWHKQRDNGGRVVALWPLRPDRIGPHYGGAPQPDIASQAQATSDPVLMGWNYWPPGIGQPQFIPSREVLVFLQPDPGAETGGIVEGLGPLQVLAREVEADNEATNFVGALLKNHAMPGSLLTLKQSGVTADQAKTIKRIFMAQFQGARRGEPAVLDGDTAYQQLSFNLQQLEFPQLRNVAESRIAAAFGVPAILVGLKAGIEASIRATITEQRRFFTETTLASYWRRYQDCFTNDVVAEFGQRLEARFDMTAVRALVEQSRYEMEPFQVAFSAGAITINEYRANVLKLPPLPAAVGEVLLQPSTSVAAPGGADESALLNSVVNEEEQYTTGAPKSARAPRRPAPVTPIRPARKTPTYGDALTVDGDPAARKRRREAEAAIAAALAALGGRVAARAADLPDDWGQDDLVTDDDGADLTAAVDALWADVVVAAGKAAGAQLGPDVLPENERRRLLHQVPPRVAAMLATTAAAAVAAVAAGQDAGEAAAAIAARVAALPVFGAERAATIAREEAHRAYNLAALATYRRSGRVQYVRVSDGVDFDDACRAADGSVWPIEDAEANPSQHPRCVRSFQPLIGDAEEVA